MLTIGAPGLLAFTFYLVIVGLIWHLIAWSLAQRNPDSSIAKAMLFIF